MKTLIVTLIALFTFSLMAQPAAKVIQSTLTAAAKVSGKTLSPALRKTMTKSLSIAVKKHGEAALKATRLGGLEVLKQGSKYGDDFWRIVCKAEPQAVRSLALHAEELLPIAKRVGPKFLELEAKTPGLGKHVVACFGDKGAKTLAHAPANDISRLVGAARKADSPATRKLLFDKYCASANKESFLNKLNWKVILASGLSSAAVIAAYKTSNGVEKGLVQAAEKCPEGVFTTAGVLIAPFSLTLLVIFLLGIWPLLKLLWKWSGITGKADKNAPATQPAAEPKEVGQAETPEA